MADQYIIKCELAVNGQSITDFTAVEEGERELTVAVNLMNKSGFAEKTQRYQVVVTYVPPAGAAPFDWAGVRNGTLSLEYDGGRRVLYSGVVVGKLGPVKTDGEKEQSQDVTLFASERKEE